MERDEEFDCLTDDCQPLPDSGPLVENLDIPLSDLVNRLSSQHGVSYGYVMSTLRVKDGKFCHMGCGPNFQGGWLTLCTCKWMLRTYKDVRRGTWIAGFEGLDEDTNRLFYFAKTLFAFDSQSEIWNHFSTQRHARALKAAELSKFGDLFQTKTPSNNRSNLALYEPFNYKEPCSAHPHLEVKNGKPIWHWDIDYRRGRYRPKFLVFEPKMTFIWSEPAISRPGSMGRGQSRWNGLGQLLRELKPEV